MPTPTEEPEDFRMTVVLDPLDKAALDRVIAAQRLSMSDVIRLLIRAKDAEITVRLQRTGT